jgi:hypothetical protein
VVYKSDVSAVLVSAFLIAIIIKPSTNQIELQHVALIQTHFSQCVTDARDNDRTETII